MSKGLNPRVIINNENWDILPNSLKFTYGFGEIKSEPVSFGEVIKHIDTQDLTTKISKISFDVKTTYETIAAIKVLKANFNNNTCQISDEDGNFSANYRQAKIMNEPDFETGSDGKVTIELSALPVV